MILTWEEGLETLKSGINVEDMHPLVGSWGMGPREF